MVVDHLVRSQFSRLEVHEVFKTIRDRIRLSHKMLGDTSRENMDLSSILKQISELMSFHDRRNHLRNPLVGGYLSLIDGFQEWFMDSYATLEDLEKEFVETLYQLLAYHIGDYLGHYIAYAKRKGRSDEQAAALEKFLSESV